MTKARYDSSFHDVEERRLCAQVTYFLDDSKGSLCGEHPGPEGGELWGSQAEGCGSDFHRQTGHNRALYKRNNAGEIPQQWL